MRLKQKLPVTYLLFTFRGRISRGTYLNAVIFIWLFFFVLFNALDFLLGYGSTLIIYPLLYVALTATATKRLHDSGKLGYWLFIIFLPVVGLLWLCYQLLFKRGDVEDNRFGSPPHTASDYLRNEDPKPATDGTDRSIVNDVTQLNPVVVSKVFTPSTLEEVIAIVKTSEGQISVGGGRFSMGGQTASPNSIHISLKNFDKVLDFSKENKTIKVQTGVRWCDIQEYVDPHDLSVKIMQTYANFTVGGSLSVNVHGRYIGLGPLILAVRSIDIVLADGTLVHASRKENTEIFHGAIGGYNALGIIVAAELDLAQNLAVSRSQRKMRTSEYKDYFFNEIRENKKCIFHNGDLYPPLFQMIRGVTWTETDEKPTVKTRLMPLRDSYPLERYFLWAFTETPFGKWRREFVIDPLVYRSKKIHWRNYEAGYDVAELEPRSRKDSTYVLLEYFAPVNRFDEFVEKMTAIFTRHKANVVNVSVRHAKTDPGSYMAWAREEVFAFVVYYKQKTGPSARGSVSVWTRELIDAVISVGGSYYLPYQAHATREQFLSAYPGATKLLELKSKLDPDFRFTNVIWDQYYAPSNQHNMSNASSEFKSVYSSTPWRDNFYRFLQVVFHLYPEDRFHALIAESCKQKEKDEEIYKLIQSRLKEIKPFLSEITYALPALKKQKKEMARQTLALLGQRKKINGYLEIGSTGRYVSELRKHVEVSGDIFLINDIRPDNSLGDIFERGQLGKIGKFFDLNDYDPIPPANIPDQSVDVVTLYIGLHHSPPQKLADFVRSIHRVLRPGGQFIIRDHDVKTQEMAGFVSLVHTVFNLGLNVGWEVNEKESKSFKSIDDWCRYVSGIGFVDSGKRLLQDNDPSDNTLVSLTKK